jgi:hypothetical protein
MALARRHFVNIPELEVAAGKRIAMLKLPADYSRWLPADAATMLSGLAILRATTPVHPAASRSDGMKSEVIIKIAPQSV